MSTTGLYYKRGDTWRLKIAATDPEGQPVDMAGCVFDMAIIGTAGTEVLRLSTETGELTLIASGELHLAAEIDRLLTETAALAETDADPTLVADLDQHLRDARDTSAAIAETIPLDRLDTLQLEIATEITAELMPATYLTDIQITWPDSSETSSQTFQIIVLPDITR